MAETMVSCLGSKELLKGNDRKRGSSSLYEDASPDPKNKIQRVGDYNFHSGKYIELILPRFSPNSVIIVSFSGKVMGIVEDKAEQRPKDRACHELASDATAKKLLKRKRDLVVESFNVDKESFIFSLQSELDGLFKYFTEVSDQKVREDSAEGKTSKFSNSAVACLLEESELPFSKLVEQIFEKLKKNNGGDSAEITLAAVRSSVLFVGQRSMYGVPKADADILEDDSRACLWCWEVRDLKLLPKSQRATSNVRRLCRREIHERIMAVSAMISSLSASENQASYKSDLMKAAEKLARSSNQEQICALANSLMRRNSVLGAEKETRLKEQALIKEMEQNKCMVEKEQKRLDRKLRKERLQNEKELMRQFDVVEKEEKRREKEEAEIKKQLKRHHEEVERDQKHRLKQEAELKKQLAIKKQASIMERFLKRKVTNDNDGQSSKGILVHVPSITNEGVFNEVVLAMDQTFSQEDNLSSSDLLKLHIAVWRDRVCSASQNKSKHWGIRQHPKVELIKELRLQGASCEAGESRLSAKVVDPIRHGCSNILDMDELNIEKLVDGWGEAVLADRPSTNNVIIDSVDIQILGRNKKLLQFDKSHRPAYYGTMLRKSDVVGPRHPLRKDPNLDYDNDSDEEWEEEDPGENLSDFDNDDEEEKLEADEILKSEDEDGGDDGFVVPDGYLSENEGVYVGGLELDSSNDGSEFSTNGKMEAEREEIYVLLKQQNYLCSLTDHSLRKNQPLIIQNLMHERDGLMTAEEISGTLKLELICLQALSIRPVTEGISIDITSTFDSGEDKHDTIILQSKNSYFAFATDRPATALQESDLPEIVQSIQSCSRCINKVMESLQKKFPSVPKVYLRNKVKEISDFLDNRWQVKKDVLNKLGLSLSPEKCFVRSNGITTFFTKRCLPPEGETVHAMSSSPQQCKETVTMLGNTANVSNAQG